MIYFDHAASSLKRVDLLQEIINKIEDFDGNPDSIHGYGRKAKRILEESRRTLAKAINTSDRQVIFTSGASESNNTVISNFDQKGKRIIASNIEHPSILEKLKHVDAHVTLVPVKENGKVDINKIIDAIDESTDLVTLMYVNNETGVIQDVEKLGEYLEDKDIWFHVDAVQALGHIDIDVEKIKCDSLSLSGHKIGGLNGFGILYLRKNLKSLIYGGEQEKNRRAGTSNVFGAYTMAQSIDRCLEERDHIRDLKAYMVEALQGSGIDFEINGCLKASDHILNIYLPKWENRFLLTYLDMQGICVSAGSACMAGTLIPSYVITNMYDDQRAKHSLRLSFGYNNSREEIDKLIRVLKDLNERKL